VDALAHHADLVADLLDQAREEIRFHRAQTTRKARVVKHRKRQKERRDDA